MKYHFLRTWSPHRKEVPSGFSPGLFNELQCSELLTMLSKQVCEKTLSVIQNQYPQTLQLSWLVIPPYIYDLHFKHSIIIPRVLITTATLLN